MWNEIAGACNTVIGWVASKWTFITAISPLLVAIIRYRRVDKDRIAERRSIYGRLRTLLDEALSNGDFNLAQINRLAEIRHDAEFCFPRSICRKLNSLSQNAVQFSVSNDMMRQMRSVNAVRNPAWGEAVTLNQFAHREIAAFQARLVADFKRFLVS